MNFYEDNVKHNLHTLTIENTRPGEPLTPYTAKIKVDDYELNGVTKFRLTGDAEKNEPMKATLVMSADWDKIEGLADITIKDTSAAQAILRTAGRLADLFKVNNYEWNAIPQGHCIALMQRLHRELADD